MRFFIVFLFVFILVCNSLAAETRSLRVVAKDPASGQQAEVPLYNKSYAVIIGIDQYQNLSADRQLSYAVRDARGVAQALAQNYRFDKIFTLYNKNATKEQIMKLLTVQLPKEIGKNDSLFVFWAGHGNQELTPEGEIGFLIPYDGSADEVYRNVTMTEIRDTISRIVPAKHVFYAMDACYSGLLTTRAVDSKPRRDLAYLKEITKERVRQVLTAGARDQQVLDGGPSGHSVFTGRLIEILEASGDFITANEIQAILKERVFNDAKGRGYVQTPSFGSLSGNGDFVFVPNIQQKVQDNKAELARLEAELKQLEVREAEARRYQSEQQQREAEQHRKAAEARLRTEQLRQQQLAEEAKRQQELAAARARFEAAQKQQEQERVTAQQAEEKRLALLKAELARKKQAVPIAASGSLHAAVAEIKRLNAEIGSIEAAFTRELEAGKNRITSRYDTEINHITAQKQALLEKDEFESQAEFETRIAKQLSSPAERIAALTQQKQEEINDLAKRLDQEQQAQTKDLRQMLQQLANKQFTIGPESLTAELGAYDAEKQFFPINIRSKNPEIKLAMNGTIPLPRDTARKFKQDWQIGIVRPQAGVTADGVVKKIALVNDGDGVQLECWADICMNGRLIYADSQTGLQWLMDGNFAGIPMDWDDARVWVKKLNVAGLDGWRLPSKDELKIFFSTRGEYPLMPFIISGFKNLQLGYYWSDTIISGFEVWCGYLGSENIKQCNRKAKYYIWPVRDAK